jgi:DNA polymerase-3 subunit gamma/tau
MATTHPTADAPPPDYTVVARRYRPQQFADLIGQEHVAGALANALTSGRIAHAYLLTGARGTGKTSTARILAKALNCEKGPTPTPCDLCPVCVGIMAGDHPSVHEIDGASNNKVEDARDMLSTIGNRGMGARFKVYIIDEVHMLTVQAFNALLKTLEEPPAHVKFIFATTEVQKIPVTILSRCQRFDFAPIGPAKVFATLKHIVRKEGLEADDDALKLVSRRAGGSMRDAQTLLDQLLGSATGRLTAAAVHALLGTAGEDRVGDLADAILAGNADQALGLVADAADHGAQLGELADQLVDYWRGLMLAAVAGPGAKELPGSPGLQEKIRGHAAGRSLDAILSGIDVLTTAKAKMRGSPHAQVLLEVAVVRLSRLDELLSVTDLARWVGSGTAPANATATASRAVPPSGTSPVRPAQPVDPSKKNSLTAGSTPELSVNGTHTGPVALTAETVEAIWPRIIQTVGPMKGEMLRQAGFPAILGPNSLAIRFSPAYTSAYDACVNEAGNEAIRAAVKRVTGIEWTVRVEQHAPTAPVGQAIDRSAVPAPPAATSEKALLQLPIFQRAAEIFDAKLVRVDDGFSPVGGGLVAAPTDAATDIPDADEG